MKIKVFWESNNKEKSLGKHLQYDRNEDLKKYPKNLFFFDFSKTLENNKDEIVGPEAFHSSFDDD